MTWLKITTPDALYARLEAEVAQAGKSTYSGCKLPKGRAIEEMAWCPALPQLPAMKTLKALPTTNQSLLAHFRNWLHLSGWGVAGRLVYGYAGRLVFSLQADDNGAGKDWREIDVTNAWPQIRKYMQTHCADARAAHHVDAGLTLFGEYVRVRQMRCGLPRGQLAHVSWPATEIPDDSLLAALGPLPEHDSETSGCVPLKQPDSNRRAYVKSKCLSRPLRDELGAGGLGLMPVKQWPIANQALYQGFRNWLNASGYSASAVYLYGLATRLAFSLLVDEDGVGKDWRTLNPDPDFERVHAWLRGHYRSEATCFAYAKGLDKLKQYLLRRQEKALAQVLAPMIQPIAFKPACAAYAINTPQHRRTRRALPQALQDSLEAYWVHCQRNWPQDRVQEISRNWWSHITLPLRLMREQGAPLEQPSDVTPPVWFAYVDTRRAQGLSQRTLNAELSAIKGWLWWLDGSGAEAMCAPVIDRRMLRLKPLRESQTLPKDVPPDDLLKLQRVIELESLAAPVAHDGRVVASTRWRGMMDLAWFLLMLHSGLRTGEVRRLKPGDIDWSRRQIRIVGSKHLKSRLAPMSVQAAEALNNWMTLRTDDPDLPETVFLDRHKPLSQTYCYSRLQTYALRCGIGKIHPHQLRHSCATLLLNAGMPLHQVQAVLGHTSIETTRGYARSYDGTVAADYTRAMLSVEKDLGLAGGDSSSLISQAEIIALLDSLKSVGVLNPLQLDTLALVRAGVVGLAKQA